MSKQFDALVVDKKNENFSVNIKKIDISDLPEGEVLIKVHYSGINYKDSLATIPNGNIVKSYPFIPGIDLAGVVVESEDSKYNVGDEVIATSYDIGVSHYGGYSKFARIPSKWVVPLPKGLSLREAMIIGTAGFTAALSVQELEDSGLSPKKGKVLVTGATGGVGSFAVSILSSREYEVEASTGKKTEYNYLQKIGAKTIISRDDVYNGKLKPLATQKWAGAVDSVGGTPLASVLSQISYRGAVAVSGLTAGTELPSTVFPFILRGVNLLGIDSVYCPMDLRLKIWDRLATDFKPEHLESLVSHEISLKQLPKVLPTLLKEQNKGRIIVNLKTT